MRQEKSYSVSIAGLLVATGVMLPFFTAHMFGIPGTILLPMHIPVLLCGLLCGAQFGTICGVIVPVLSSLLTNMPTVYPMLPIMAAQLMTLGLCAGLFRKTFRLNLYAAILLAMIAGWAVYGVVFTVLTVASSDGLRAAGAGVAVLAGLPGIAVQMILCPMLVQAVERAYGFRQRKKSGIEHAAELIRRGGVSCVVLKTGKIVYAADGRGVSPLLALYEEHRELLKDAVVVDKIIGKAAASILLLGEVQQVYSLVISVSARDYMESHGVAVGFERCVDVITARGGVGICPIERSVLDINDPIMAYRAIKDRIQELSQVG